MRGTKREGSFTGDPEGYIKEDSGGWAPLSIGAPLGKLEGRFVYRGLRETVRGLWKWSISLYGGSARGTWRDGTFTGGTEEGL
jgi:hypothetical protein